MGFDITDQRFGSGYLTGKHSMATAPNDRRYLATHEWHRVEGDSVVIGISNFAADELTDITYVKLPAIGQQLKANQPFGEIESVKATADLYTGLSGTVTAINEALATDPGLVNREPFAGGWMVKMKMSDAKEVEKLLGAEEYVKGF